MTFSGFSFALPAQRWVARGFLVLASAVHLAACSSTALKKPASPSPARLSETPSSVAREPSFVLGPEDQLTVTVWRQDDLETSAIVEPDGNINMKLIGEVEAAGATPNELSKRIAGKLARYIQDPKVTVSVTTVSSRKVLVLGEVKTPGLYAMNGDMSAWEAVAKAGGFSANANRSHLIVVREEGGNVARANVITMNSLFSRSGPGQALPQLQNRDILYVMPTTIASVEKLMGRIDNIIRPFLSAASAVVLWSNAWTVFMPATGTTPGTNPVSISTPQ